MKRPAKLALLVLVPLVTLVVLAVLANFLFTDFLVDVLWYRSLGYTRLFFLKIGYKYLVFGAMTLIFFLLIFFNFWTASRYLGATMGHKEEKLKKVIRAFRSGSMKVYTPLSLLLAIPLALPLYQQWENALLFFFAPDTGVSDSLFNLDVSFYLFALPILTLLQSRLLVTLFLMVLALMVLYAVEMKWLSREKRTMYRGARIHFAVLLLVLAAVQLGGYLVEALMLQYSTDNLPLFYGPGYAEIVWGLPMLGLAALMVLLTALALGFLILTGRGAFLFAFFAVLSLITHFTRNADFLVRSINTYVVVPNELSRQSKFMEQSIQSTLTGYRLQEVERRPYEDLPVHGSGNSLSEGIDWDNIPLWDNELLGDVYQQLQAIRPYYRFSNVDAARYRINGELHQVYLAARELEISRVPSADRWVNRRLKYTHGYGLVMTPAAQRGGNRMRWYIRDMPPKSSIGFDIDKPAIYYGMSDADYVIAPNKSGEFHYPGPNDQELIEVDYEGSGGVDVTGPWRRILFTLYFKERNLLFTTQTVSDSRIHFRRNIQERVARLTPFLQLDHNPYLVATQDRLYWIQDAYTTSRWYPNSQPYDEENDLNYIRNSVKIVVDAYTGQVDYYLSDPTDPIALAYQRMYPNVIHDLEEMPADLKEQIRYPRDLFDIQMRMYARYHQTDPAMFYQNEDMMQYAEILHQDSIIRMRPYYLTLDLIEPGRREFMLLTPMIPYSPDNSVNNLRALAVVSSAADTYGRMVLYTFPKGSQILGPSQVNSIIDQNPEVAQKITLWNQEGSEVKRGKMIVLPVNGHILYIQPLYMESTGSQPIPQLKRVIVSADEKVVMAEGLEEGVKHLEALIALDDDRGARPGTLSEEFLPDETPPDTP